MDDEQWTMGKEELTIGKEEVNNLGSTYVATQFIGPNVSPGMYYLRLWKEITYRQLEKWIKL